MKGHTISLAALALVFLFVSATAVSFAHPPSDITATYNPEGKKLVISVRHQVPSVQNHYISEIVVTMDNKVIAKKTFTTQSSKTTQDVTFVVAENLYDKTVVVEAKCCVKGTLKKSFEFKKPEVKTDGSGATPQPTPAASKAPSATKAPTVPTATKAPSGVKAPSLPATPVTKGAASSKVKASPYPTATKKTN